MGTFLHGEGSGVAEPNASLDHDGLSLRVVRCHACCAASLNAEEHRGLLARSLWPLLGHPLRLLERRRSSCPMDVCGPSSEPATNWRTASVQPPLCIGRDEGTERFLGRRDSPEWSLHSLSQQREHRNKCVVQPCWCTQRRKCRRNTLPGTDCAGPKPSGKKGGKSALRASLSLDNRGPHKG
jgi:hypothetical protein